MCVSVHTCGARTRMRGCHQQSCCSACCCACSPLHALLPASVAAAGAAVIRMLRAWANRDNRAMPLPTYETVPGATPSEVSR